MAYCPVAAEATTISDMEKFSRVGQGHSTFGRKN